MPRPKTQLDGVPAEEAKAPHRAKQETVGVVLSDHHKASVAVLQELSGLSRSDIIRQLLDHALGYRGKEASVLDIVINRPELQQQLLAALQEAEPGTFGRDDLSGGFFVRRVTELRLAAAVALRRDHLKFEGYITFTADVLEGGVKRNKPFTHLFMAEVERGPKVRNFDLGPEAEEIGPVGAIIF